MRRTVTPRARFGDFRVLARFCAIACIQRQPREKIMNLRLLQAILTAVSDGERFFRVR